MAKKEKITETAALDSLKPGAQSISQPESRTEKLSAILGTLGEVDKDSLTQIYDAVMAKAKEIGHGPGVGDVSDTNKNSLNTKPSAASSGPTPAAMARAVSSASVREDLEHVFEGANLSEEFMEKIPTIFESAVNARVAMQISEAEELMIAEVEEYKEQLKEEMTDRLDSYLEYVAEQWLEDNEIAITNSLKVEMADSFLEGLRELFAEHNAEIPEGKVDVVNALSAQLAEAESKVDELVTENSALKEELTEKTLETAFEEVAEGLVLTQAEKLRTLSENISFDGTVEDYKKKVGIIKEKHFPSSKQSSTRALNEEHDGAAGSDRPLLPANDTMARYALEISKTLKH